MGRSSDRNGSKPESNRDKRNDANRSDWLRYMLKFRGYDQTAEDARDVRAVSERTMYIDKDDYEFFIDMRTKSSLLKYAGTILSYVVLLIFAYFLYSQAMSMQPNSEYTRPSWALLYVPMMVLLFLKTFNQLSVLKISF